MMTMTGAIGSLPRSCSLPGTLPCGRETMGTDTTHVHPSPDGYHGTVLPSEKLTTISVNGAADLLTSSLSTAEVKWEFKTGNFVDTRPCLGLDGTVYVGSEDGNVYALDKDGKKLWEYNTNDSVRSSPSVGPDGTVYVGSDDGRLYALRAPLSYRHEIEGTACDTAEANATAADALTLEQEDEWLIIGDTRLRVQQN